MSASKNPSPTPSLVLTLGKDGKRGLRQEILLDGLLMVRSRDGLGGQEKALTQVLPKQRKGRALLSGCSIVPAVAMKVLSPDLHITLHLEDHWDWARANDDLQQVPEELRPELVLAADPPQGPFQFFGMTAIQQGSAALLRELIRSAAANLLDRQGLFYAGFFGESETFIRKEIQKAFPSVTIQKVGRRHGFAFVARRPDTPLVNLAQEWESFTIREGEQVIQIEGRPGVFCHDRLDQGTRALLACMGPIPDRARILDLGCGTGIVTAALAHRAPDSTLFCLDASARAIESTRRNLETLGLLPRATLILQSQPEQCTDLLGAMDMVVTNPPYYGNWRISENFLRAARLFLRHHGRLILVTKGPSWFRENTPEDMPIIETALKGGYSVITFQKTE